MTALTIFALPGLGIHKLEVTDTAGTVSTIGSPHEIMNPAIQILPITFDTGTEISRRPIGLFGRASFDGVKSIGIIFIDPGCRPGVASGFVSPDAIEIEKIVYVDKVVKEIEIQIQPAIEPDNSGLYLAAGITGGCLLLVVIIMCICLCCCIRKNNTKIQMLETEKADWSTRKDKNSQAILWNVSQDDSTLRQIDDSAREGLKAGQNGYRKEDEVETIEINFGKKERDSEDPTHSHQDGSYSECEYEDGSIDECKICINEDRRYNNDTIATARRSSSV